MAREAAGHRGGSAALLELIEEHKTAVAWDFRRYLNLSLDDIGTTVSYGEAIGYVHEMRRESGSHTHMLMHGFTETMSLSQFTDMLHAQWYMNVHKRESSPVIKLPIPWGKPDPNADVTPERRAELVAQLGRRSAFA